MTIIGSIDKSSAAALAAIVLSSRAGTHGQEMAKDINVYYVRRDTKIVA